MVKDGKMTKRDLERIRRMEAAHANAIENYPVFFGTVVCFFFSFYSIPLYFLGFVVGLGSVGGDGMECGGEERRVEVIVLMWI